MARRPRVTSATREAAKDPTGVINTSYVRCEGCHAEWEQEYVRSPLFFRCVECGRRRGVRIEADDLSDAVAH